MARTMNWAFSTLGCPEADFAEVMRMAEQFSVPFVEIRMLSGTDDLAGVFRGRFGTPKKASAVRESWPAKICVLGTSCRMIGCTPGEWEGLVALAPWADAMQVPFLRVFDSRALPTGLQNSHFSEAANFLRRWQEIKMAKKWKVEVIIETHSALTSVTPILKLQEHLLEPAPLLWDSHHTWHKGAEHPSVTWPKIQPWVRHIHIKDSPRPDSDAPNSNHHVIPGQGEYPFDVLFSHLQEANFPGVVSLEWEKHWQPALPPLAAALASCRALGWW